MKETTPAHVPEILAPAGGRAQFFAALNAGADAVYLGLKTFNARARAENFTEEELRSLVPLAHAYGMKVLVTLNILIKEAEVASVVQLLNRLTLLNVDGVIVQDLGVAQLARTLFPTLRIHASTQMAVHNVWGVRALHEAGFRRVVLARELTISEIASIHAAFPAHKIELESFCHGSLCYSYSGLCLFSGLTQGRSGNRGECAYSCRQSYKTNGKSCYPFSMKDLDSLPVLEKLVTTGVHTLKIEGRKKDAQYVATVVARYRRALDTIFGRSTLRDSAPPEARSFLQPTAQDENALSFSFQRAPTSLFLTDRSNSVIDTTATTHAGLLVGNIQRLSSTTLVLRTAVPLEKYDGLRFGAQEFSLRSMKIKGRPVTQAPQGAEVEIELPLEKASLPTAGMPVYKTRCSRLKATVDGISHPPAGARIQPRDTIDLSIHLQQQGESVLFTAEAYAAGACFLTYQQTLSLEWAKKESRLEEDIRQTFRLFGDAAFAVNTLNIEANPAFFIPKSLLKELKNIVGSLLRQSYQRLWERTANELMTSVDREFASAANSHEKSSFINRTNDEKSTGAPTPRYALKVDSVENLAALSQALTQTNFSGNELIFEAHPVANQDEIFSALHSFSAQHPAISLRLALPAVLRAEDAAQLRPFFAAALAQGFLNFEVGNVGGRAFLQELGWSPKGAGSLVADHTLYVMNHEAALFLREQGFCRYTIGLEDDLENVARLLKNEGDSLPAQAILYSVPTLFVAEGCTLAGLRGSCPGSPACSRPPLQCEGESPKEQLSITHRECRSFVHPTQPFAATHLRSQFEKQGVSYFKLEFVLRRFSAAEIATVLEKTREESPLPCSFSGNLGGSLR